MRDRTGSPVARWLAVIALGISAIPLIWTWRSTAGQAIASEFPVLDWPEPADGEGWVRPGEIAVQLKSGASNGTLLALGRALGVPVAWNPTLGAETGVARIAVPSGMTAEALLTRLRRDPSVEAADVVHLYRAPVEIDPTPSPVPLQDRSDSSRWRPNDPRYPEQWNFRMVRAEEAWERSRGKGVVVAVIDTGVAYGDTRKGPVARDFKQTPFVRGYDFVNRDDVPYDDHGHGTHVAGTVAESTNNREGVAGLAFEATIMPLKVLNANGGGTSADIAAAIRWAADRGAKVINMSLGGPFPDRVMRSACEYARSRGVTIVCAAGNSGREGVGYPAAFPECIAVSAVGPKGELSFYSSWGRQIAIAAPGGDRQQDPENGGILQNTIFEGRDDYFQFQGTSMASPHVAAVAAMVVSRGITDPEDVKAVLQKTARPKGPSNKYGAGILDAASATRMAALIHGDGVARFWMVVGLFAGCFGIGYLRRRAGSRLGYPFWGTAALAFGLVFPDWLTGFLGMTSGYNLIGHSILIPGALLVLGAEGKTERRLLGWMAFGLVLHLGWEFLRGTTPFGPHIGFWQLLPWVTSNVLIGCSMLVSGLTAQRDY